VIYHHPNIIERAYELAPQSDNIDDVKKQLSQEGYTQVDAHLGGPKIRADLRKLMMRQAPTRPAVAAD
jgi:hypothetical protein